MTLIFILVYSVWFFSEISLSVLRRSAKADQKDSDKGSLGLIWTIIIISNFLSYFISQVPFASISENQNVRYIGLVLITLGVVLRLFVVASLGKFFTVNVTIRDDHKLKTDGFYKYLRHPSYSASLLSFIGYGISLNNWISLIVITSAVATAFMIRIRIEEHTLIEHFGQEYLMYKKKTKRLIPFIY